MKSILRLYAWALLKKSEKKAYIKFLKICKSKTLYKSNKSLLTRLLISVGRTKKLTDVQRNCLLRIANG